MIILASPVTELKVQVNNKTTKKTFKGSLITVRTFERHISVHVNALLPRAIVQKLQPSLSNFRS